MSDKHIILRLTFDTALGQRPRAVAGSGRIWQTGGESPSPACFSLLSLPMPTMPTATATTGCILCPTKTKVIFIILTGKQITSSPHKHQPIGVTAICRQGDTHILGPRPYLALLLPASAASSQVPLLVCRYPSRCCWPLDSPTATAELERLSGGQLQNSHMRGK